MDILRKIVISNIKTINMKWTIYIAQYFLLILTLYMRTEKEVFHMLCSNRG